MSDRSANRVLEVTDQSTDERFTVYRCDECKALVLYEDAREHLWWHETVLYVNPATLAAARAEATQKKAGSA